MAVQYSTALRTTRMTSVVTAIDAGAGAGLINVYSGSVPTNPAAALGGATLLATLTCSDPCGTVTNGVLTFSAITQDSSADASGTPTFARITDSTGSVVLQVSAGVGSGDINFGAALVSGQPVQITSFTLTDGSA
jgi:hypothetical protein